MKDFFETLWLMPAEDFIAACVFGFFMLCIIISMIDD